MENRNQTKERLIKYTMPEPNTGCWFWIGCINNKGYGTFSYNGKNRLAHRISYFIHKGESAKNKFLCHTCDVTLCVNPDHLFIGTPKDNMADMARKGRSAKKLTDSQVIKIFKTNLSQRALARKFNVSHNTIHLIKNETVWSHVTSKITQPIELDGFMIDKPY